MPDDPTPSTPITTTPTPATAVSPPQEGELPQITELSVLPEWAQKEIKDARNEAAKYRVERNELRGYKDAIEAAAAEAEEAEKTEVQKANERIAALEAERSSASTENARLQVRLELGLTAEQAEFLSGSTAEEMKASAEKLLATFAPAPSEAETTPTPSHQIVPQVRPAGLDPTVVPEERDPVKLAEAVRAKSRIF